MESPEKNQSQPSNDSAEQSFQIGKGLALSAVISSYIIGPLIAAAVIGWFLDKQFGTKPWILLACLALSFVLTNILIYKQSERIAKKFINEPNKTSDEQND